MYYVRNPLKAVVIKRNLSILIALYIIESNANVTLSTY